MFRKLIWCLRYAKALHGRTHCGWRHAWYCSGCSTEAGDWAEVDPDEAAREEAECY